MENNNLKKGDKVIVGIEGNSIEGVIEGLSYGQSYRVNIGGQYYCINITDMSPFEEDDPPKKKGRKPNK